MYRIGVCIYRNYSCMGRRTSDPQAAHEITVRMGTNATLLTACPLTGDTTGDIVGP